MPHTLIFRTGADDSEFTLSELPASDTAHFQIVPAGLLAPLNTQQRALLAKSWPGICHLLERQLRLQNQLADSVETTTPIPDAIASLATHAREHGVRSFAECAAFINTILTPAQSLPWLGTFEATDRCVAWHVKEGLTTSVWQIRRESADGKLLAAACLNIARDDLSAKELVQTTRRLARWRVFAPDQVAQVLDLGTHHSWMSWEDGQELHLAHNGQFTQVGWFVNSPDERGHHQLKIYGRQLDSAQNKNLWQRLAALQKQLLETDQQWPGFDINEGDLMLRHDGSICLIACNNHQQKLTEDAYDTLANAQTLPLWAGTNGASHPAYRSAWQSKPVIRRVGS